MIRRRHSIILALPIALAGCASEVLAPSGDVAVKLRDVLGITTALILVIVLPVMAAIVWFSLRYSKKNRDSEAHYDPKFSHSTQLELLIWTAPLLIITWLGALTWVSTHKLDPYRPLDAETAGVTVGAEPLVVQVVSMDWKWLFIYPQYGVATVNELAAPLDRQIRFELTSTEVMNAFYVPTLAGMIYTMPGMQTQLHAVINKPGQYRGMSSHYSGAGFSGMNFPFYGLDQAGFDSWIEKARNSGQVLTRDAYQALLKPSENVPPAYYALGDQSLYHDILNRCVNAGQVCMDQMMNHGAQQAAAAKPTAEPAAEPAANGAGQDHTGHAAMPDMAPGAMPAAESAAEPAAGPTATPTMTSAAMPAMTPPDAQTPTHADHPAN
ncbi:ubiquinol oxidase subunit II [Paracoccus pacificus]|uniref:Ubiquinol oxidase polypeptide II n=1 Tax=Paracoccus pacificus TaxID=1463598 RepID=A0ABW4R4V9_9RHOB